MAETQGTNKPSKHEEHIHKLTHHILGYTPPERREAVYQMLNEHDASKKALQEWRINRGESVEEE